ncbi:PQQ-dependent sugar dehydrogenase [Solimonas sp. K1W22B-7]|uniref:PQQ-dependent sugar dehydrogenase n=1 Tax=Solimonas sp. K1W22B-7 TaxID=2303331 RepID=UPI000E336AAA|nr:PQQ-dependent sugar dehydrogenase [Solimonas sp. K1W22B-7]AXQ27203.1 PQQ-dependent sugar dehydrogenase [Solimonas sp. K1W22B-7]
MRGANLLLALGLVLVGGCSRGGGSAVAAPLSEIEVETVASGLAHPWAMAFLPDGRILVTEKPGRMRLVNAQGGLSAPLAGVPAVAYGGQGGLLDVVLDPQFAQTQRIYFSYSEPRKDGNGTAVAHARLGEQGLQDLRVIFRQQPAMNSGNHFGSRLAFAPDGKLFVTLGERYKGMEQAQALDNDLGKVIRIDREGGIPPDNPFAGRKDARPELWSYGHRNPQGAAIHPQTGRLWTHEHGPQGGDEINLPLPGRNYGWPVITWGIDYSGAKIGKGETLRMGMEQPLHYWVPSIAPSGMAFYTADRFPAWRGQLFVGSLKFGQLVRLELDGERVKHEARYDLKMRIRDVRQGPDGYLYLLTDDEGGRLLKLGLKG